MNLMMQKLLLLFFFFIVSISFGQKTKKYPVIDSLINKNSTIDALTVIRKLK